MNSRVARLIVCAAIAGMGATRAAEPPQPRTAGKAATLRVGKDRVPLSSQEMDAQCAKVVAPFDIDVNAATLAKWSAREIGSKFESILQGGRRGGAAQHKISRDTRDEAARMNWLPMSVEQKYGQYVHRDTVDSGELVARDSALGGRLYPAADALLSRALKGIKDPHPYKFEVHVRKNSTDNAQALPGGIVYLDAGLFVDDRKTKPQPKPHALFALSHEIGHVLQRHETRIVQARIIDTLSLTASVQDLVATVRNPAGLSDQVIATAAGGRKAFQKHYESQELHADACSVRMMDSVVENDAALVLAIRSFLESLPPDAAPAAPKTKGTALEDLLETANTPLDRHPTTRERRDNLEAMLRAARREAPR